MEERKQKESNFKKLLCSHCEKMTWHFKTSERNGFECECQTRLSTIKTPNKPITYSAKDEERVEYTPPPKKEKSVDTTGGLRSRYIPQLGPKPLTSDRCVGCGVNVTPGKVRTGSVLGNLQHFSIKGVNVVPIEGEIEFIGTRHRFVYRVDQVETVKKVAFRKREKGYICDKCASNCHTLQDPRTGERHLLVKTDPPPGFYGQVIGGTGESGKEIRHYEHETSIYDPIIKSTDQVDARAYNAFTNPKRRFDRVDRVR